MKLGVRGEIVDEGIAYSTRVIRCQKGYQVLISFSVDESKESTGKVELQESI